MRFGLRLNICARPRRPTVDGAPPLVHLHDLYAGGCRAGPPLTGRRTTCVSITLTFAALYTLRATPHPAPPAALPKLASGLSGGGYSAGNPAPTPAAHVDFFFIGLAGLPAAVSSRETPHPATPHTLPKLASGRSGTPHPVGNPAPCYAPHAAKIGLAGVPAPRPPRVTPHPATSPTFLFSFPLRRWFHVAVRYFLRCGRVTDPPLQVQARGRGA